MRRFLGLALSVFVWGVMVNQASGSDSFSQTDSPKVGDTVATIRTNLGVMKAKLFVNEVPNAAKNFVELAQQGKYSGAPFHRIIKGFMIQGGDFTNRDGTGGYSAQGPGTTIEDQYSPSLSHIRGALSWAKTSRPKSIGSQFFIVHPQEGTHFLDHQPAGGPANGYSVFGQLFEGFEVLDKIATTKTGPGDRPLEAVSIESVEVSVVQ